MTTPVTNYDTKLPPGVIGVSPVYPVAPQNTPAPVAPPQFPMAFVVAAVAGGAIAWIGASGFYGAADVKAMRQDLGQAQETVQQQQQQIEQVRERICQ
ncbi:MAG: hypothetical protein HC890_12610 [Chloroflexaceae bacterium]|nr:hypothetical protein [Chloroflexaceae bacterium]